MKEWVVALCVGYLLDRLLGDPHRLWHPVQGIGKLIEWIEKILWKIFALSEEKDENKYKKSFAGFLLVVIVLSCVMGTTIGIYYLLHKYCPQLKLVLSSLICYQMLAAKSLKDESMKVYDALSKDGTKEEQLMAGRNAVAMIVGRDTESLSVEGVVKATVETIAENTSDGVIAPLFYMALLGPLGGLLYKTVNTMDSMIAYRNTRYYYFGTAAAKLDDLLNYLPARISALVMIQACGVLGFDKENSKKIYKRDRYNHKSPNSAHTEAVCAGALRIQLAGPATYFGELHDKPTIGDKLREVELEDIKKANQLLTVTANMFFAFVVIVLMILYLKFFQ